jgi:hypothetical protein
MHQVSILVVSCDKYADLWKPFFKVFRKQWPDCPYPIYLGTNFKTFDDSSVTSIPVGPDNSWSGNLRKMLDAVQSSHVILLLEDFFFLSPVDTSRVDRLVELALEKQVGCLRLCPRPRPTRRLRNFEGIGVLRRGDDWRVSTQIAVWDTGLLKLLAWPGFTAWHFEEIGSLISYAFPHKFWGLYEPAVDYMHVIWRGKWLQDGLTACERLGVTPDLEQRSVLEETHEDLSSQTRERYRLSSLRKNLVWRFRRYLWVLRPRYYIQAMLQHSEANTEANLKKLAELNFFFPTRSRT